jgi:hypothetical protein
MSPFSKDTVFKLKALGVYQLLFAVAGCILTAVILVQTGFQYWQITVVFAVVFVLYFYAILCGIFCLQQKKQALPFSLVNQYLQLVSFSILGYGFKYVAAFGLYVGVDLTHDFLLNFKADALSFWTIQLGNGADEIVVNFNLVAMVVIIIINRLSSKMIAKEEEMDILEIGNGL